MIESVARMARVHCDPKRSRHCLYLLVYISCRKSRTQSRFAIFFSQKSRAPVSACRVAGSSGAASTISAGTCAPRLRCPGGSGGDRPEERQDVVEQEQDRKSTRLNSSHLGIS